ncbi:hypothetical protein HZB06_00790 [Candidatus Wolfebacteria bacterium]|nr:hypothetical protein [Candidatus Wolfebacteria bacterium]
MDKKISLPEIIIMVLLAGSADLFGLFSGFAFAVPVIGQALIIFSFFVSLSVWIIIQFWLIMKKVGWQQLWYTGGSLGDIIFGGVIPAQTPALLWTIFLVNNPKLAAITKGGVAGGVAGAAKEAVK